MFTSVIFVHESHSGLFDNLKKQAGSALGEVAKVASNVMENAPGVVSQAANVASNVMKNAPQALDMASKLVDQFGNLGAKALGLVKKAAEIVEKNQKSYAEIRDRLQGLFPPEEAQVSPSEPALPQLAPELSTSLDALTAPVNPIVFANYPGVLPSPDAVTYFVMRLGGDVNNPGGTNGRIVTLANSNVSGDLFRVLLTNLASHPNLVSVLDLSNNPLTDADAATLVEFLPRLCLQGLLLNGTMISGRMIEAIVVAGSPYLQHLDISNLPSCASDEVERLRRNRHIQSLRDGISLPDPPASWSQQMGAQQQNPYQQGQYGNFQMGSQPQPPTVQFPGGGYPRAGYSAA
ncbi:MAG: hypothetical protein LBJ77_02270 [Holosporales bacterium]|nr:hypothetical protein [Holosporales bacterium]